MSNAKWMCTGMRGKKTKVCTRRLRCKRWLAGAIEDIRPVRDGGISYPCMHFIGQKT